MERLGIIDIGSNTIRLVVYDVQSRLPIPMFNEKAACRLAAGLAESGCLNPDGTVPAINAIGRFVALSKAMEVDHLSVVATAAVREAEDGPDFVETLHERYEIEVDVLSAEEEARLAAVGVLHGCPGADGVVGDLGGGSLDLVLLTNGQACKYDTAPLGHLRLQETSHGNMAKADDIIQAYLQNAPWLREAKGQKMFMVGGAMRALARVFIAQMNYPLHIVDNYSIGRVQARDICDLVARMSPKSLRRMPGISRKRIDSLPLAALVLGKMLDAVEPCEVVFSSFGMREGKMVDLLPSHDRSLDPMIAACEAMGSALTRFSLSGRELYKWISPVFDDHSEQHERCRLAAAFLSDLGWNEHPDFRAMHAYERTLRLPLAGLDHAQRVFLALSIYVRYGGVIGDDLTAPVLALVDDDAAQGALLTGQALRLGHVLAGSAPGLLKTTRLKRDDGVIILDTNGNASLAAGESVPRRLKNLAKTLGLDYQIDI